ncbi:hypothetical protein A4A49_26711 [Nicotiana attenuata]|uniref:Secreted protein n=1 Tax=Nicotiana attenuata TaxID=49451 RepID=A0A314KHS5_NICAT|nr:hypothetical protein A4A49_26711 [Nicotiana attenuata]
MFCQLFGCLLSYLSSALVVRSAPKIQDTRVCFNHKGLDHLPHISGIYQSSFTTMTLLKHSLNDILVS